MFRCSSKVHCWLLQENDIVIRIGTEAMISSKFGVCQPIQSLLGYFADNETLQLVITLINLKLQRSINTALIT